MIDTYTYLLVTCQTLNTSGSGNTDRRCACADWWRNFRSLCTSRSGFPPDRAERTSITNITDNSTAAYHTFTVHRYIIYKTDSTHTVQTSWHAAILNFAAEVHISRRNYFCRIAKFGEGILNNGRPIASGRYSLLLRQFWPWTLTLTSDKMLKICQNSWKSDFYFWQINHNEHHERTNQPTNKRFSVDKT